jgi:hypothetical protein
MRFGHVRPDGKVSWPLTDSGLDPAFRALLKSVGWSFIRFTCDYNPIADIFSVPDTECRSGLLQALRMIRPKLDLGASVGGPWRQWLIPVGGDHRPEAH